MMKLRILQSSLSVCAIAFGFAMTGCEGTVLWVQEESWESAMPADHGTNSVLPGLGRRARRLTVDNLRRSIPRLFEGADWRDRGRSYFHSLRATLGEADYLESTESNLSPNPIFAKYMDDMATHVCRKAIQIDNREGAGLVVKHPDDPAQNIRFLRLKLHAIYVPDDSFNGVSDLHDMYEDLVAATESTDQAWLGVCIAMLTAPEFMAY